MDYIDFHLKIGPRVNENQYTISSRSSSIGETGGVFTRPLTDEQLELFVLKVGLARRSVRRIHSPEWRAAQDFGQKLFRALFNDEIRAAYLASYNDAVRQGKGLRIQLTLDAPELANYPWEFLYDPSNSQFLSLFEDTPILRYLELSRPILPLTVTPPLRILAVASSPKDYEQLDLARERRNLTKALDPLLQAGLLELDWLPTATLEAVREQLLKRQYHIFHFIGHGGFDERQQDGVLLFENAVQYSNRVSGERLAVILGNHRTLRLAVLNACEGARTSEQDPFAGTATTLVRTGNMPAVIAMQFEITDNAAINFASGFYGAIAAGRPVDAAVSQGRQAIFAADNDVEWSTPVLYLRASDGMIFNIDTSRAIEETRRIAAEQAEQARLAHEKLEAERRAAEQAERERLAHEQAETRRAAAALIEQERIAAARAEQERLAREKLQAERLAAEQAEQERLAREKLEAERAAAEQLEKERLENLRVAQENAEAERVAAAKAEQERLAREKLQAERAAAEQAEKERREKVRVEQERLAQAMQAAERVAAAQAEQEAQEKAQSEERRLARKSLQATIARLDQAEKERREKAQLEQERLAQVNATAERAAAERADKDRTDNARRKTERLDQDKATTRQATDSNLFGPPPAFTPERIVTRRPKTAATSIPSSTAEKSADPLLPEMLKGIVLLSLSSGFVTASTVAFSKISDDLPRMQFAALVMLLLSLALGVIGIMLFGRVFARLASFDGGSTILLAIGWSLATLLVPILPHDSIGLAGKFTLIGIVTGSFAVLALRLSNPNLPTNALLLVAAAWVIGFVVQAAVLEPAIESANSSVWELFHPLYETLSDDLVILFQVGLVGLFFGWIGPAVGIAAMLWQLRAPSQKESGA